MSSVRAAELTDEEESSSEDEPIRLDASEQELDFQEDNIFDPYQENLVAEEAENEPDLAETEEAEPVESAINQEIATEEQNNTIPEPEAKPDLTPPKPRCPISLETFSSQNDIVGAPDGRFYQRQSILNALKVKMRSPFNKNMVLTPSMLFKPVGFYEALTYTEHKESKYQKLENRYKRKKDKIAELTKQVEELKAEKQQLENENAELKQEALDSRMRNKFFKTHIKRKLEEVYDAVEDDVVNKTKMQRTK